MNLNMDQINQHKKDGLGSKTVIKLLEREKIWRNLSEKKQKRWPLKIQTCSDFNESVFFQTWIKSVS